MKWASDGREDAHELSDERALLEYDASVHVQDENGQTPLHLALQRYRFSVVRLMVKSGKSFAYAPTVQLLLEHGASVRLQNKDGLMPLHVAMQHRNSDVVALLLQLGAPLGALDNDNVMSCKSKDRKYSVKAQQVCLRKGPSESSIALTKSFIL